MVHRLSWDEVYRTGDYKNYWGIPYPSQELVTFIAASNFTKGLSALDVGCGAGQESIFLAKQGFSVTGIDQSSEALKIAAEKAKQAGVQVNWHEGNVLDLPLQDQSIDMINDRGCFHVITDEYRAQYASEMARVLKPGGKILMRGCRDPEMDHFTTVTAEAIDKYFSTDFDRQAILPIQLATGKSEEPLKANLVLLTRR